MGKKYYIFLFIVAAATGGLIAGYAYVTHQYAPRSMASQSKMNFSFSPTTQNMASGETKTVTLLLQPADNTQTISGIDLTFVTTGQVGIKDIAIPASFPDGDSSLFTQVVRSIQPSQSRISYVITRPSDQLPHAVKITISVQGIADGTGTLSINASSSQIVGKISGYAYDISGVQPVNIIVGNGVLSPTLPNTITPSLLTPTPSISGMSLLIKLRLQGVVSRPISSKTTLSMHLKIGTGSSQNVKDYELPISYTDSGLWTGKIGISEQAGSGYYILFKGPFHLQKRICDTHPVTTAGIYKCKNPAITLVVGENVIDLSDLSLAAGDLKMSNSKQDGFVNSYDASYIRERLGSSSPEALEIADINLDGVVDTQDYSLVIETLSSKQDVDE